MPFNSYDYNLIKTEVSILEPIVLNANGKKIDLLSYTWIKVDLPQIMLISFFNTMSKKNSYRKDHRHKAKFSTNFVAEFLSDRVVLFISK